MTEIMFLWTFLLLYSSAESRVFGRNNMVYTAQPGRKSIENDVIQRMNIVALEGRMPTQFELAALHREIEKLKNTDFSEKQNLLGMLSALELDVKGAKKHHRAAIRASGGAPQFRIHYAVTLTKLFIFDEAIEILERLAEEDPSDLDVLTTLIRSLISGGRFRRAKDWAEVWSKRCPGKTYEEWEYLTQQVIPVMDADGLEDRDVAPLFERALKITVDHRKHVAESFVRWPDEDHSDLGFCLVLCIRERAEVIEDLIVEFCENEAAIGPPGDLINKVSVSFSSIAA